jgi:hypothetical protein
MLLGMLCEIMSVKDGRLEIKKQTTDKMTIQILQMNNMVIAEEFNKQNIEKAKEQAIMDVNELK